LPPSLWSKIQAMAHTDSNPGRVSRQSAGPPVPAAAPARPRQATRPLSDGLRSLARDLCPDEPLAGRRRSEDRLRELAALIRNEKVAIRPQRAERALRNVTGLYGNGFAARADDEYTGTAAGYAAVVSALSRRFPALDFAEAVGQLLDFMIRLFKREDAGWAAIYRHLRAVPDTVAAKQQLKRVCSAHIAEWFDAGVQNLFGLREEPSDRIAKLAAESERLDCEIQSAREAAAPGDADGQRVVALVQRTRTNEIAELGRRRQTLLEEQAEKTDTVALIEADIQEFEHRLWEARRAYLLRPV
jgi:hypothetical protein